MTVKNDQWTLEEIRAFGNCRVPVVTYKDVITRLREGTEIATGWRIIEDSPLESVGEGLKPNK